MAVQAASWRARWSPRSSTSPTWCGPARLVCAARWSARLANAAVVVVPGRMVGHRAAFATGVALAAVYPPAMKMAASWFTAQRGLALGLLIGALTLGKAVPYLVTTIFGDAWRRPCSGLGAGGRGRTARLCVTAPKARTWHAAVRFDPHAIRASSPSAAHASPSSATSATCGSSTRCGRGWACSPRPASPPPGLGPSAATAGSLAAFLAIGSGAAGCVCGRATTRTRWARRASPAGRWSPAPPARRSRWPPTVARPDVDLRAGHCLGLGGGRRLGAVLGARQRVRAAGAGRAPRSPFRPRWASC
jgi:hypothetical protein